MKYIRSIICFSLFCLLSWPLSVQAETILDRVFIDEDTTLLASDGPFLVKGGLIVLEGATLTISPGVDLRFANRAYLDVYGQLNALGTEAEPIHFHPEIVATDPSVYSDWGLAFYDGRSKLSHLNFENSANNIFVSNAKVEIEHSIFSRLDAGIWFSFSDLTISDTIFSDIESDAISGEGGRLTIASTSISQIRSGDALGAYNQASVLLDRVRVSDIGSGSALGLYGSTAEVNDSVFVDGKDSAIELYRGSGGEASTLTMHNTSLIAFPGFGLYVDDDCQANVVNNWWGHRSGPLEFNRNPLGQGTAIFVGDSGVADFVPWLKKDPSHRSSVAFFPGIQASRLYEKQESLGGLRENQLWEPNRSVDVEKLFLDDAGKSQVSGIYTREIIDQVNILGTGPNIYRSLISFFDDLVIQNKLVSWQAFPYDWRLDLEDIFPEVKRLLTDLVAHDTGGVTLVAHSNGGLVAKWLLSELQRLKSLGESNLIDSIDGLILVATPQLGTPQAIMSMLHGDNQGIAGGLILQPWLARAFSQNMFGAYHLLPATSYFTNLTEPIISFTSSAERLNNFSVYQGSIKNAFDFGRFLVGSLDHRSSPEKTDTNSPALLSVELLDKASRHHDILDSFLPVNIPVTQIVGWGIDTVKAVTYSSKKSCTLPPTPFTNLLGQLLPRAKIHLCTVRDVLVRTPRFTENGDKTVVVESAIGLVPNAETQPQTFFVNLRQANASSSRLAPNRSHADIFEVKEVRETLEKMLSEGIDTSEPTLPSHVSSTNPNETNQAQRLIHFRASVHSPVTIDLFDSSGNHTGQATSSLLSDFTQVEEQVPGSSYQAFGEDKYISFASNDFWEYGEQYTLILSGTGYGTFSFEFEEIQNDQTIRRMVFTDVPVNPQMKIILNFSTFDGITELPIDIDGNGKVDERVRPGEDFDGLLYLKTLRQLVSSFCMVERQRQMILLRLDQAMTEIFAGDVRGLTGKLRDNLIVSERYDSSLDNNDFSSPELVGEMVIAIEALLIKLD